MIATPGFKCLPESIKKPTEQNLIDKEKEIKSL